MSYKNFVSHSVIDNNQEQVIDTEQADDNDSAPTKQPEIEYDPRTLYERLQEQKTKKEDEFREATRFSNLVKRVDPDEAAYYKSLSDTQQQLDEDLKLKEMNELEEYRRAVEQARAPPTTGDPATTVSSSVSITTTKRRKSSLDNVGKPKKNPLGDLILVKKKRGADDNGNDEDKERQHKKTKQQENSPKSTKDEGSSSAAAKTATTKSTTTGLTSLLAAYDDDSDSGSD